jgi:hypothetical protein
METTLFDSTIRLKWSHLRKRGRSLKKVLRDQFSVQKKSLSRFQSFLFNFIFVRREVVRSNPVRVHVCKGGAFKTETAFVRFPKYLCM